MIRHLLDSIFCKMQNRLTAGLARQADLDVIYNQIAGLFQIQNALRGDTILKPMRGWALSPDAMALVLAELSEHTTPTVIEFGSGQSTIILAAAIKHRGGRFISIEHDDLFLTKIRRQAEACGLTDAIEFIHAPLSPTATEPEEMSYDVTKLPKAPIDIALVDGPPISNGLHTRLTPMRWAARNLTQRGSIFLDDANRETEQTCLRKIQTEMPHLQLIERVAEKGMVQIQTAQI